MLGGSSGLLLIAAVVGVGVLHTVVPDHWAPIALLARQRGWSKGETARAALQAGFGHVVTTLLFGLAVWFVGAAVAQRFGQVVDIAASVALVTFGGWIAVGAWRELRGESHVHSHDDHDHHNHHRHHSAHDHDDREWEHDRLYSPLRSTTVAERHVHAHRHGSGPSHVHWHDHPAATAHAVSSAMALSPPVHEHQHRATGRTALLLVLGSSPMVEGIPAFFAAARYGTALIVTMSLAFAASTIATYVVLSVYSASSLQRLNLGPIERYGEVLSGVFIAAIGLVFGLVSVV
jgi:hypothetical protein